MQKKRRQPAFNDHLQQRGWGVGVKRVQLAPSRLQQELWRQSCAWLVAPASRFLLLARFGSPTLGQSDGDGRVRGLEAGFQSDLYSGGALLNGGRLLGLLLVPRRMTKRKRRKIVSRHASAGPFSRTSLDRQWWNKKLRKVEFGPLVAEQHSRQQPAACWQIVSFFIYFFPTAALKPGECHSAHTTPTKMNAAAATSQGLQPSDSSNLLHRSRPAARWHSAYHSKYCSGPRSGDLPVHVDLRALASVFLKMQEMCSRDCFEDTSCPVWI